MTHPEPFHFRLYVVGEAPNSGRARANLEELCRVHLCDRHRIEIVDLARDPERALADGVYITPTLVKLAPSPTLRIVGNLSDSAPVLAALGLATP